MGLLVLLGLNGKKEQAGQKEHPPVPKQNPCCGSCGGNGHTDKKESRG